MMFNSSRHLAHIFHNPAHFIFPYLFLTRTEKRWVPDRRTECLACGPIRIDNVYRFECFHMVNTYGRPRRGQCDNRRFSTRRNDSTMAGRENPAANEFQRLFTEPSTGPEQAGEGYRTKYSIATASWKQDELRYVVTVIKQIP